MRIAVVAPFYNEEKHLDKFIKDVRKTKLPFFLVDDGSTDNSINVAKKHKIKTLTHKINLGKGAAMKTGAEAAFSQGFDAVVFIDTDGQHKLTDLPKFIKALKAYDIVFGSRNMNYGVPLARYLGNKFASLLISLLFGIYVSDLLCGYRALTKKAYEKVKWESSGYAVETEMVIRSVKAGLKHCEVPVATVYLDNIKGVSLMDAFGILFQVVKWKINL